MKPVSKKNIDDFLDCKVMAIAGASRDKKSFSAQVAEHLETLGYELWLINPYYEESLPGQRRLKSTGEIPSHIDHLLILTPSNATESIVKEAVDKGIKNIWVQQKSETPQAIQYGLDNDVNLIYNQCIFMFTQPTGIHKFHFKIKKFFGGIPS